ncbi:MAG: FAD-binding protein [Actinobacteria bacterium]|nr:FAD-binding protein [Actinomycetota bacterium]
MSLDPPDTRPTSHQMSIPKSQLDLDVEGLVAALERTIEGEVRFSDGDRHLYSTDASNFRQIPLGVVLPKTLDDVIQTHKLCRQFGAPITNRGGGTSLAGQACNVAVILDTSKYLREIVDFDPANRTVTCQPGIVLDTLRTFTAREASLTWGPDPSTHNRCTVGGMIGNNACGIHAFAYGRTEDNVKAMDVLLYDGTRIWVGPTGQDELEAIIRSGGRRGEIYGRLRDLRDRYADLIRERFPDIPRRVSGYNLTELLPEQGFNVARALVGTEGTCVTVLQAKLDLNPYYPQRVLLVLGYPDVFEAGDHVAEIRRQSKAIALEGIDQKLIEQMEERGLHTDSIGLLPEGRGWLLVEFGADTREEAVEHARELMQLLRESDAPPSMRLYDDPKDEAVVWDAREAGLGATAHTSHGDDWPGWEDSAVHPDRIGDYLRDLKKLFHEYGLDAALYGHFGDGCVHCRINFDLITADGVRTYREFLEAAAELVSSYDGSYSGEHGDGQQRAELLDKMFGPEIVQAFREFKAIWDPDNSMNPGKVVDPYRVDQNLRLGANYRPWEPQVKFGYPQDGGSFAHAALLCVGVGKCRRDDGHGVMCPSYMVTHEEMHSTRGRARLLFEMLQPDSQLDGWRDEHVKEALELCLSCKGCTTDCPVNVDMPTYKAEFFYHHYKRRLHPPAHYALGLINVWSRLASFIPGITNGVLRARGLSTVVKKAAGIAPQRPAPIYAGQTFHEWFEQRPVRNADRPPVLLFPDTFTNYFHPAVGKATVTVLEDAGYQVTIPPQLFCCGRPLYDYGFLDLAQRYLDRLIDVVRAEVSAGVKIIGMEPSCTAVFRDELVKMKPHDVDARRIAAATMTLSEFLLDEAEYDFPRLDRKAVVHGHCHHKGTMGMDAEFEALDQLGLDWEELDAGCCGLAGSFGFEAGDKFDISVKAGERKLLPAVRDADGDTLIVANGFSCATQIDHLQLINGGPGRRALHLAQVVQLAKDHGPDGPVGPGPVESAVLEDATASTALWTAVCAAAATLAVTAGARWLRRR